MYKRIKSPNLIDSAYKKNLCTMYKFSPSIIKWVEDKAYNKIFDHPLNEMSVVMDVGGFTGNWTEKIYNKYGCNVIVYEPVLEYFSIIKNRFIKNDKIIPHNYGLGKENKEILINKRGEGSTIYNKKNNLSEKIKIKNIQEELSQYSNIDLMSINIEGGEYELLDCILSNNLTSKINNIQIEFHERFPSSKESPKLRKDIQDRLSHSHELTYCYPFYWENWTLK